MRIELSSVFVSVCLRVCLRVCVHACEVCVCVCERERERESLHMLKQHVQKTRYGINSFENISSFQRRRPKNEAIWSWILT